MSELATEIKIPNQYLKNQGTPSAFHRSYPVDSTRLRYDLFLNDSNQFSIVTGKNKMILPDKLFQPTSSSSESNTVKNNKKVDWNDEESLARLFEKIQEEDYHLANFDYAEYAKTLHELESAR